MKNTQTITVWVTKYLFTIGIRTANVSRSTHDDKYVYEEVLVWKSSTQYVLGKDAFLTEEEAIQNSRKKIKAKRLSLQKQIDKLASLEDSLKK